MSLAPPSLAITGLGCVPFGQTGKDSLTSHLETQLALIEAIGLPRYLAQLVEQPSI